MERQVTCLNLQQCAADAAMLSRMHCADPLNLPGWAWLLLTSCLQNPSAAYGTTGAGPAAAGDCEQTPPPASAQATGAAAATELSARLRLTFAALLFRSPDTSSSQLAEALLRPPLTSEGPSTQALSVHAPGRDSVAELLPLLPPVQPLSAPLSKVQVLLIPTRGTVPESEELSSSQVPPGRAPQVSHGWPHTPVSASPTCRCDEDDYQAFRRVVECSDDGSWDAFRIRMQISGGVVSRYLL